MLYEVITGLVVDEGALLDGVPGYPRGRVRDGPALAEQAVEEGYQRRSGQAIVDCGGLYPQINRHRNHSQQTVV